MDVATQRLSHAQEPALKIWFLDPHNNPVRLSIRANINNGVTYILKGKVLIYPDAAEKGWRKMQPECTPQEWAVWSAYSDQCDKGRTERPDASMLPACIRKTNDAERRRPFVPPASVAVAAEPVVDLPDTVTEPDPRPVAASGLVSVGGKADAKRPAGALSRKAPSQPDGSEDAL
jgi:hypothetical protein